MQLASYGTRGLPTRYLSRIINPGINNINGTAARSIHIAPLSRAAAPGTAQKVVQQTRNIISRFFAHLTAPGLRAPPTSFPTVARSLHTASKTGIQGIHANLSLPARYALSRGPFLPRAPMVPRTMTQVGLGAARNFSSTRPIFQNLVHNVPIAGRAFWEADLDFHGKPRHEWMKFGKENSKKQEKTNEMIKAPSPLFTVKPESTASVTTVSDSAFEHYFPAPRSAGLTTYLLIPLAPTPTTRHPLSASPLSRSRRDAERLLLIPEIAALHTSHTTHTLRVSSLFARLDAGNVWDKGVECDTYGDSQGVCMILRVSFTGWSAAEVRSVIGESGTGWCELYEVRTDTGTISSSASDIGSEDGNMSDMSLFDGDESVGAPFEADLDRMDPSQSFVLPTLDFSSSFLASPTSLRPRSPSFGTSSHLSESDIDLFSCTSSEVDVDSRSSSSSSDCGDSLTSSIHGSSFSGDGSWMQAQPSWYGSSRFGFSSEFVGRLGSELDAGVEPREYMF